MRLGRLQKCTQLTQRQVRPVSSPAALDMQAARGPCASANSLVVYPGVLQGAQLGLAWHLSRDSCSRQAIRQDSTKAFQRRPWIAEDQNPADKGKSPDGGRAPA